MEKSLLAYLTEGSLQVSNSRATCYYILWCDIIKVRKITNKIFLPRMVNLNPIKSYSLQEIEGLEAVKKQHKETTRSRM